MAESLFNSIADDRTGLLHTDPIILFKFRPVEPDSPKPKCKCRRIFTTHDPAPLDSFTDSTHPVASQNKHVEMADLSRSLHPSSKQAPRASLQTMDTPVTDVAADMEAAVEQIEENMRASSVGRSLGSGSGFLGSLASAIRSQPPPSITEQAFQQTLNLQPGLGEFRSPVDRIAQRDRHEEIKQ